MKSRLAALIAVLALLLAACASGATTAPTAPPSVAQTTVASSAPASSTSLGGSLTIFGAASLKAALTKAQAAFTTTNPGVTITISTDSSSTLETQIEQGAPADVLDNPREERTKKFLGLVLER